MNSTMHRIRQEFKAREAALEFPRAMRAIVLDSADSSLSDSRRAKLLFRGGNRRTAEQRVMHLSWAKRYILEREAGLRPERPQRWRPDGNMDIAILEALQEI